MSLVGHLDVARSDRVSVDRAGTLRDRAKTPVDVAVDNLSTTGCLFVLDRELPLGALVSLGIPGIGVRYARISRVAHPHYACAFLAPVSQADIEAALSVDTLVAGAFPQMPGPVVLPFQSGEVEQPPAVDTLPVDTLSVPARLAIIAGGSIALWALIGAAAYAFLR